MKLEELIRHYISPVKRFDQILPQNYTAEDIYNHYKSQAKTYEIESFIKVRFSRKFRDVCQTQDQQDWLNEKAKNIASVAQQMFVFKFPQFYQEKSN